MSDARASILETIRAALRGAERPPLPARVQHSALAPAERVANFAAVLARVGGCCERVADAREAGRSLARLCADQGVRRLAVSDAPELAAVLAELPATIERLAPDAARADLLAADAGLTSAQWGIAETGTLVLESARERHRLASLLPRLHVALLPRTRLLGTLGEALAAVEHPSAGPRSRTITFVTGPSRTADIELELVVGVHGPKVLHVLLLDSA